MKRWKDINWLWVAGTFSIVYCAIVGSALGWSRSWDFFTTDPKLNEAGDFLAGVFAPLALIWLVAAVLTQRQELNETRDQFTENQKVVDAQLKTINSQNELLTLQHQQSVENAAKAYRLSLFDKRFEIYQKFVNFGEADDFTIASHQILTNLAREAAFVFDRSIEAWLDGIADRIVDYLRVKGANPLNFDPVQGEAANDERYREARQVVREYRNLVSEQFEPDVRTEKFWRFMNVSDQPYEQTVVSP